MRTLPISTKKNGYIFNQVERWTNDQTGKSVAIYEQKDPETNDRLVAYEVFVVPVIKGGTTPTGYTIEAGEKFPSNEQFGISIPAACVPTLERAYAVFEEFKEKTYGQQTAGSH